MCRLPDRSLKLVSAEYDIEEDYDECDEYGV